MTLRGNMVIYGGKTDKGSLLNDIMVLDLGLLMWIRPVVDGVEPGAR